jgi:hypothetical protein
MLVSPFAWLLSQEASTIETIITEYTSDVDSSMQIQNGQLKNLYLTLLYSMFRRLYKSRWKLLNISNTILSILHKSDKLLWKQKKWLAYKHKYMFFPDSYPKLLCSIQDHRWFWWNFSARSRENSKIIFLYQPFWKHSSIHILGQPLNFITIYIK